MADMDRAEWWVAQRAEMDREIAAAQAHAATPQGRLEAAERRARALDAAVVEGTATTTERDAAWAEVHRQRAALADAQAAAEAAEWTREVTIARRAEWAALVQGGTLTRTGQIWWPAVREQERQQGWTLDALKAAVARHGL